MTIAHRPSTNRSSSASTFDMCRRRHHAAQRVEPTTDGVRDPLFNSRVKRSRDPRTIMSLLAREMPVTREQCHIVWYAYPEHRPEIEAVAAALEGGWAA